MTDQRVDELREQLRALGYLDAGVDRFLLAPAGRGRGPVALAVRSSVRVGLLGGVLLGPAAAIGVGARLPGLITGVRDAVVIAVYLAVFFFVAITITSFAVALGATLFARRRNGNYARHATRVARVAGWVTSVACLIYLTLWWRSANAGFGWSAPTWTAFALVIAVGISLLLGHAQRITTIAVIAARSPGTALPPVSTRSWRMVAAGALLAFAGASALLLATASTDPGRTVEQPALTVVSRGQRVRLIAIDGFDRNTYLQLRATLPRLSYTLGFRCAVLDSQNTSDPARAWTTIATGVPPEVHGVHAVETRRVAGIGGALRSGGEVGRVIGAVTDALRLSRPAIASREDRRAKTLWEIVEQAGLKSAVVNWWATWPAPPQGAIVVTDRAVLRLERGGALDGEIAPSAFYERLLSEWPAIRGQSRQVAARSFATGDDVRVLEILRRSAELDAAIIAIAQTLPADLDLSVVYLPGLDIAQNALLGAGAGALTPSDAATRVEAIRSYYPFLDRLVGPLLDPSPHRLVMVITQPGRVQTGDGMFALGPDARLSGLGGVVIFPHDVEGKVRATPVDIAPTVLRALGVPLSRELAGKPSAELLQDGSAPDRFIDTYGKPFMAPAGRTGKPLDQEMIDRLRSLGYIK